MKTPTDKRIAILTDFWTKYYQDEDWEDVMRYADIALPLCYAIHNKIVKITPKAKKYIDELWDMVIENDFGFDNLSDVENHKAFTH